MSRYDEALQALGECEQCEDPDSVVACDAGDMIHHPPHYTQGDIECIDAIEAALTEEEFRGYCKAAAIKYIWRERHKGQDESIRKAIWYLERLAGGPA